MFAVYQIFQCLVKFDVFFWVGFCVQFTWLVLDSHSLEFYITCAAIVLSVVLLVEGHLAARYENKWMMISFLSGCVAAMVYFCYKFIKIIIHKQTPEFSHVWESLSTFAVIAILLLIMTFIYAWMVMRNFGRGLKDQISRKQAATGGRHGAYPSLSVRANRMSID
jgi:small-conductance mechanosensitive channel